MDSTIVDTLFSVAAAVCLVFLLCGGWLCLRYGHDVKPYSGTKKAFTNADRASAARLFAPTRGPAMQADKGRGSRVDERAEEVFNG